MKHLRYTVVFVMLIIQSCSVFVTATPTPEQPSPVPPTPTTEILEPTTLPAIEPPAGFKQYQDTAVGVSIY